VAHSVNSMPSLERRLQYVALIWSRAHAVQNPLLVEGGSHVVHGQERAAGYKYGAQSQISPGLCPGLFGFGGREPLEIGRAPELVEVPRLDLL
jgi:hypothetical protein